MTAQISSGRELTCTYGMTPYILWPSHPYCIMQYVDFSSNFKSQIHSFSGSASQRSEVKVVRIENSPRVDFIPVEVFSEFPNLNGFYLYQSNLPATIKSGFFTRDFKKIE